jgi:tetratricopeptide (TPR) repeat protein
MSRPEVMYVQIGELYERNGAFAEALQAYQPAADHDPSNVDLQARVARMLASLGRRDEALSKAADLVVRARATPESLDLLRDVCHRLGIAGGEIDALAKLHRERPDDRAVLSALADSLLAQHRTAEAERLLESAWERTPGDVTLTRRLFALYKQRDAVDDAARLLVVSLAHDPDALRNLTPLWNGLLRPGQRNRLQLPALQAMKFPADAEAAKQFWISRIADLYHRDALAKSALQHSIQSKPPFAPAYRALLAETWAQDELSAEQKIAASDQLADTATAGGDAALATELHGLVQLNQKDNAKSAATLAQAIKQGGHSPDLQLAAAVAGRQLGKDPQFEQALWKIISDYPLYEDAYAILFRYYADPDVGSLQQAMKVLSTWLGNDPQSTSARLVEASVDQQLGQTADAESILNQLFAQDPDNPEVLEGLRNFYTQARRLDAYLAKLEDHRAKHPQDTDVVARLVDLYAAQKRVAEATRVLDATRAAVASDPDLLYNVAQLYAHLDQKQTCEDVLQQVVRIDPAHASASNDLGYTWADQGRNMAEAESLIRVAVNAEPDNESFLDSLGWVLYKRGKFDEARRYLEQAVGPAAFPDPVVLDHLGDTLYRLSRNDDATKQWQRSLKGIGEGEPDRDDLKQLRIQLIQKLKEAESHKPVDVAPTVESATASIQAKQ